MFLNPHLEGGSLGADSFDLIRRHIPFMFRWNRDLYCLHLHPSEGMHLGRNAGFAAQPSVRTMLLGRSVE